MNLKPWQKNILSIVDIIAGGFLLFNFAFLLTAIVTNITIYFMGAWPGGYSHITGRVISLFLIAFISWLVFRTRVSGTIKAMFLTMPTMVTLVMVGIAFYQQPQWVIVLISALIILAVLSYLYKKNLSWLYYFSIFYVCVLALFILFSEMDI